MTDDEIKVCDCGDDDILTPLLWTFKFPGAEYWCPRCGYTAGMLGAGINVPVTYALKRSKVAWRQKAEDFLTNSGDYFDHYGEKEPKKKWEYDTEF
jgi:hypothetical protein